ncbi:MAG: glycosyltransferase, partial [Gloeomargarita sp. SKYG116]|nr:glycosyltransferase [Gloeomargarita sp. SKYG116]MDW8402390.1 glycosyltransferase [Gloeomargarita sp. SKYGB_i_bin116]
MIALDVRFLHVGLGRKKPAGAVGGIGKVQLETYRHFLINKPFRYILLGSSRYSEKVLKSSLPNFSESEVIHLFEKNRIAQTLGDRIASFLCGNEDEINSQRLSKIPEIHLVHVHEQVWPVTTKAAYKTVVTMHSHLFSKASEDWQKDEYSISDAEKRFLEKLHSCDAVLGVSRSVCDYLIGNFHIPKEKVHVTYSGVNPEVFKPISSSNKNDIESIQRRFGIRNPYFCYAGSWKKVKNIPTLIRIYEEYRKNSPRK